MSWHLPGDSTDGGSSNRTAVVATDVLNIRKEPSRSAPVLSTAVEGQTIEITGESVGEFVPVIAGSVRGWMASSYLEPFVAAGDDEKRGVAAVFAAEGNSDLSEPSGSEDQVDEVPSAPTHESVSERVSASDPTAIPDPDDSPPLTASPGERWIEVDRSEATVTLHDGEVEIAVFPGRIGRDPASDGFYSTAIGTYHVYSLNKGLAPTPFAEDTWLTDWVGFDPERKNGIHSPVRESDGTVREWQNSTTLGCVRLDEQSAVAVFEFAELGMRVEVVE